MLFCSRNNIKGPQKDFNAAAVPPGIVVGVVDNELLVNHQTLAPPASPIDGRIDMNIETAVKKVSRDVPVSEKEMLPDTVANSGYALLVMEMTTPKVPPPPPDSAQ